MPRTNFAIVNLIIQLVKMILKKFCDGRARIGLSKGETIAEEFYCEIGAEVPFYPNLIFFIPQAGD